MEIGASYQEVCSDRVPLSLSLSCRLQGKQKVTAVLTAILTVVLCIIIVLTALGNLLVMVALCKDRHLR